MTTNRTAARWSFRSIPPSGYVFLAAFILRLVVLVRLTDSPLFLPTRSDMHFYDEWAQRILTGQFTEHLAFYGLPLYAYLLAGIYAVFGYGPFFPGLLQAALDAGTAALIYKIGERVFLSSSQMASVQPVSRTFENQARWIAIAAAAGWVFFVPAQAYSVILMPTAWLIFAFWFVLWQIVRTSDAPTPLRSFLLGTLVGVTAMGIATILFTLPLLAAAILYRPKALPQKLAALALLFVGVGLGTAPAWLHNTLAARDPVFLSAHSGVNFWIGNNPAATGYPSFPAGLRAGQKEMLADSIASAEAAAGRPLKRSEVSAYWSAKARQSIAENPAAWSGLLWKKVSNFWNAFQYDDVGVLTSMREQNVTLPGIRFGFIAALALPGMVIAAATFPASRWIMAAVFLHLLSLLSVFITERYRLAAVPGLLLFGSFLLWKIWTLAACRRFGPLLGVLGALAASTWFVTLPRNDPGPWALDAYNSGVHALEARDPALARRRLELADAYVPENPEVIFALGNVDLAQGGRASAAARYHQTLALNPRHEGALNNLGVMALEDSQWEAAQRFLQRAVAIDPTKAKTRFLLAQCLLETGAPGPALTEAEAALALEPDRPEFLRLRERILQTIQP